MADKFQVLNEARAQLVKRPAAAAAVTKGEAFLLNGKLVIPCETEASGKDQLLALRSPQVEVCASGASAQIAAVNFTLNQKVYWDDTAKKITNVAPGNAIVGRALEAKNLSGGVAAGATLCFELNPQVKSAAITPNQLAGLLGWWKADALTGLSHNDPAETLTDSSGNGNVLSGFSSARALYKTNVQNGLPGLLFDGDNDTYEGSLTYGVSTVIWASNLTTGGVLWCGEGSNHVDRISGGPDPTVSISRAGDPKWARGYAATWMNGAHQFAVRGAATAADCAVRREGAEVTPTDVYSSLDPGSASEARNMWVGSFDGDNPIAGHLFELMIFNVALSLSALEQMEAYLKTKWAL